METGIRTDAGGLQIEKKRKTCVYGVHWDSLGKEPGAGKINRPLCEHRETEIAGSGKASKGGDTRGGSGCLGRDIDTAIRSCRMNTWGWLDE